MDDCVVTVRTTGARAVVALAGELDVAGAAAVARQLAALRLDGLTGLDVDLSGLRFCDLAGYEVIEALADRAETAGVPFRLRGDTQPPVRRLLSVLPGRLRG